jgi:hypothetical protein
MRSKQTTRFAAHALRQVLVRRGAQHLLDARVLGEAPGGGGQRVVRLELTWVTSGWQARLASERRSPRVAPTSRPAWGASSYAQARPWYRLARGSGRLSPPDAGKYLNLRPGPSRIRP